MMNTGVVGYVHPGGVEWVCLKREGNCEIGLYVQKAMIYDDCTFSPGNGRFSDMVEQFKAGQNPLKIAMKPIPADCDEDFVTHAGDKPVRFMQDLELTRAERHRVRQIYQAEKKRPKDFLPHSDGVESGSEEEVDNADADDYVTDSEGGRKNKRQAPMSPRNLQKSFEASPSTVPGTTPKAKPMNPFAAEDDESCAAEADAFLTEWEAETLRKEKEDAATAMEQMADEKSPTSPLQVPLHLMPAMKTVLSQMNEVPAYLGTPQRRSTPYYDKYSPASSSTLPPY